MADENNANSGHISVLDRKKYGDVVDNVLGNTDVIIKYPSFTVEDGIHVKPSQAAEEPKVGIGTNLSFTKKFPKLYTLMMVDPDAPSPDDPVNAQWLHWLVVNIPRGRVIHSGKVMPALHNQQQLKGGQQQQQVLQNGQQQQQQLGRLSPDAEGEVDKGDVLTDYMGPAPPQGTHRYVFLVYEQHMHRELQPFRTKQRPKFNAADWAKRHNLGDPVAATHFEAAPE
eukprot:jgi/Chrzof1/9713/Cz04g13040.t1